MEELEISIQQTKKQMQRERIEHREEVKAILEKQGRGNPSVRFSSDTDANSTQRI